MMFLFNADGEEIQPEPRVEEQYIILDATNEQLAQSVILETNNFNLARLTVLSLKMVQQISWLKVINNN